MKIKFLLNQTSNLAACIIIIFFSGILYADPPTRVIRLSDIQGETSFLPAGEEEWVNAIRNRPLTIGDTLWNGPNTQSLLQISGTLICIGAESSITLLNLTDSLAQLQLAQGTINLHVERIGPEQQYEIDTPNLAFVVTHPGYYRITVDENGETTAISVRQGQAQIYGETTAYEMDENQSIQFSGTDLSQYQPFEAPLLDENDNWCFKHLPRPENVISSRYVSEDVIGYEDLDYYGSWKEIEGYGSAWTPSGIAADWAPYRDGRWIWIEPWGWTWVGDEPWGFAPYHYGRWVYVSDGWYWVPGPKTIAAVYAPALVAFVEGIGDDIGWFPLAPEEIYWPAYHVTTNYFISLNISNTVINQALVLHAYQQPNWQMSYQHLSLPQAITAVSAAAFINSKQVNKSLAHLSKEQFKKGTVTPIVKLAPEKISVLGTTEQSKSKPTAKLRDRHFLTKSKLPEAVVPFKQKEQLLKQNAGKPLDSSTLTNLQEKATKQDKNFKVITPQKPTKLKKEISPPSERPIQKSTPPAPSEKKSQEILKKIPPRGKQETNRPQPKTLKPDEKLQTLPSEQKPKSERRQWKERTKELQERQLQKSQDMQQRQIQAPQEREQSLTAPQTKKKSVTTPEDKRPKTPAKDLKKEIQRQVQPSMQNEEQTPTREMKREIKRQFQGSSQSEARPSRELKKEIQQPLQAPQGESQKQPQIKREMQRQFQAPSQSSESRSIAPRQEIKQEVQRQLQTPSRETGPSAPAKEMRKEIQQQLQTPSSGQKAQDNKQ